MRWAAALAIRPGAVLRRGIGLATELGRIGLGVPTPAITRNDRAAPSGDPLHRRAARTWLATTGTLTGLLDDATRGPAGLGPADETRLRGLLVALTTLTGPVATPEPEPPAAHAVPGRDTAATPGAVVLRTPVFELIQYLPRTLEVLDVPVLVVPPPAHRYHLADLAPGHSLVEHLVGDGQQVFALSWANTPGDHGLDTYAAAVLDAAEACGRVTRCPRVVLAGLCAGGLLTAAVQSHLDATGRADRVAAAVYLGTAPDHRSALSGLRADPDPGVADRLPPGPARRALRHWAGDQPHVSAALREDLVALADDDPRNPATTVLGTPVDPRRPACDAYLVTPADDPAWPWSSDHRAAQRLGGPCRLVRACGGRTIALVAPDGFDAGPVTGDGTPDGWAATSTPHDGSWWPDLTSWLAARTGPLREAPPELGGRRLHPVHPAPGLYLGG